MHAPCTRAGSGGLRTPLLLAFALEANVALSRRRRRTPQTHTHAALTSTSESRARTGRPAQSVLVDPPQRGPGSACLRQESGRKASAVGGFVKRLCLSWYELLTHSADERVRVQTSTQPPPAQTQTHALFSCVLGGERIYLCGSSADILCWSDWCIMSVPHARSRRRLAASP